MTSKTSPNITAYTTFALINFYIAVISDIRTTRKAYLYYTITVYVYK